MRPQDPQSKTWTSNERTTCSVTHTDRLVFANCDGEYDPREKKFIQNFLRSLELNHILAPGKYNKEALESSVSEDIDNLLSDTKRFVSELNEEERKPFIDLLDGYIQGIIKADNIIDPHETYYYNMWKEHTKS